MFLLVLGLLGNTKVTKEKIEGHIGPNFALAFCVLRDLESPS